MAAPDTVCRELEPGHPLQVTVDQTITEWHRKAHDLDEASALQTCLQEIYAALNHHPSFFEMVAAAKRFVPSPGSPAFYGTIAQTPLFRLSLMGIHHLKPVPMHDHPGGAGTQLMLAGRARIRHLDPVPIQGPETGLARLAWNTDRDCHCGDFDSYFPDIGNIHDIASITSNAVLLCLQLPPCHKELQSWYFPLELMEDGTHVLCSRVKPHHRKPHKSSRREAVEPAELRS